MASPDRERLNAMARITLLTDFGGRDGYVGAMKGIMASIYPGVIVDDVSHDLAQGDVASASLALGRYWDRYPSGTVHLVVVDPGVGTERRALAAEVDRRLVVAPDNGVLSHVLGAAKQARIVEIVNRDYILPEPGHTFHGRDIFAPAAAYLARGIPISRLGPPIEDPVRIEEPEVQVEEEAIVGRVIALDHFGNLLTNLSGGTLAEADEVEVKGRTIPVAKTYGEVAPRELAALINSDGCLEVAARDSSAAELLEAGVGTPVRIRRPRGGTPRPGIAPA
ncbi:MAG: SAM-dependent chlorinase/fluorinase [Gemmatimonadota bacterium]